MLHNLRDGFDHALHFILLVARLGTYPATGTKILDFGCGSGQTVYRLRELGFDAYGFDIHDRVSYRNGEDRRYFRFARAMSPDTCDMRTADQYAIPFADDTFDLIYSASVLEHVLEIDPVMRECARVLKASGMAVHFYPAKLGLVEPHVYVPLATFFRPRWWLAFWAWAGVRNEFQTSLRPRQVVETNECYLRTGVCYRTRKQLGQAASRYFESVGFPSGQLVVPWDSWQARLADRLRALRDPHPCRALAQARRDSAIICERKRPPRATSTPNPAVLASSAGLSAALDIPTPQNK
jgi:SAM-dependent methyltransferase